MASTSGIRTLVQRWWPVPSAIVAGLVAESLVKGRYDVSGHAAEHLSSAPAVCIGAAAAIGSAALSLVFPPWIAPGFGMVVIVVARCRAHGRAMAAAASL